MRVLLDTHILLWTAIIPRKLPAALRELLASPELEVMFSAASIWEVAIKQSQRRADFEADPAVLRHGLIARGRIELPITGEHAVAVLNLPIIHRDPFDRILLAQAIAEGVELLTVDAELARYPGPIRAF
jgi:PIN domain nuclease of toxin-antitoxin system